MKDRVDEQLRKLYVYLLKYKWEVSFYRKNQDGSVTIVIEEGAFSRAWSNIKLTPNEA